MRRVRRVGQGRGEGVFLREDLEGRREGGREKVGEGVSCRFFEL